MAPHLNQQGALASLEFCQIKPGTPFGALSPVQLYRLLELADKRGYVQTKPAKGRRAETFYAYLTRLAGEG